MFMVQLDCGKCGAVVRLRGEVRAHARALSLSLLRALFTIIIFYDVIDIHTLLVYTDSTTDL